MSEWKVQAKQHFANRRSPEQLIEIKVPEWGISVFYWPAISNAEDRAIKIGFQPGAKIEEAGVRAIRVDTIGGHVSELIARARDMHGRNLFTENEFDDVLRNYDPGVLERIVSLMDTVHTTPEEAAKN